MSPMRSPFWIWVVLMVAGVAAYQGAKGLGCL